jgi:hypothetical protein
MKTTTWICIATLWLPNQPEGGIWTLALEVVPASTLLKIACQGRWSYVEDTTCGPDGDATSTMKNLLVAAAPAGCVVGRFGGSTAGVAGDVGGFPVGSLCIQTTTTAAPLFLSINIDPKVIPVAAGTMSVAIYEGA